MRELDKVLNDHEEIIWEGKPQFLPYFIGSFTLTLFGLIFAGVGFLVADSFLMAFLIPHTWIGLAFIFIPPFYRFFGYKRIFYGITDKRIILQKGIIGRDFKLVDYDKITNKEVDVGIIDQVFGKNSGSIKISTPITVMRTSEGPKDHPFTLAHISDPYNVFKLLKKTSHDVKTDIHYPNDLRPKTNKEYNTKLKK